jgi:Flp pilus assembly pilin Flp
MNKRAQNSLEYAALITAVAAVILSIVWTRSGKSPFQKSLEGAFNIMGNKITYEINKVK